MQLMLHALSIRNEERTGKAVTPVESGKRGQLDSLASTSLSCQSFKDEEWNWQRYRARLDSALSNKAGSATFRPRTRATSGIPPASGSSWCHWSLIIARARKDVPTVFAAIVDDRRLAGLPDDPRSMAATLRADGWQLRLGALHEWLESKICSRSVSTNALKVQHSHAHTCSIREHSHNGKRLWR